MRLRPALCVFAFLFAGLTFAADQQLMGLLMPDSKVVAGINVANAGNSPFGQFVLSKMETAGGLAKLTASTGFDPRHDLQEVLMGTAGQPGEKGLVLARGSFDGSRIFAAAQQAGGTVESYNGVNILTGKDESLTHAVAFLDNSIAVAGDLESVKAAIDRRASPSSIDPALAAKVDQLSGSADAWSVSTAPMTSLAGKGPDKKLDVLLNTDVLKAVLQSSAGIKFGANIQFSAEAVARTDQDATALADVVRFLSGLAQANAPAASAAAVTSLVQSLSVTTDGSTVKLGLTIPEEQVENALQSTDHIKRSAGQRTRL